MSEAEILDGTFDEFAVEDGEWYRLLGTVQGRVAVKSGGRLDHYGYIQGVLYVEAGGEVHLAGMLGEGLEMDPGGDPGRVQLDGHGPFTDDMTELPSTGPVGWGVLNAVWARALGDLGKLTTATDALGEAFTAAAAVIALAGRGDDAKLWALLSASVYNSDESLRLGDLDRWAMWSPLDCRERLPWGELEEYFDAVPELFTRLLATRGPDGIPIAYDYWNAILPVINEMLAIGTGAPEEAFASLEAFRSALLQLADEASAPEQVFPDAESDPVDAAVLQLDSLIGLSEVKEQVKVVAAVQRHMQYRRQRGRKTSPSTRHLVMTGNPGTGKTTVARLLGQIYYGYGLLRNTTLVEVNGRSGLVADIVGGTALKTRKAFRSALGGVFFIDEAYSLMTQGHPDFAPEAVTELVALMENHRDDIVVIMAGYPSEMGEFLAGTNPGLRDRFQRTIHFPDYTESELMEILDLMCRNNGHVLSADAGRLCADLFRAAVRRGKFSNGRYVRVVFEAMRDRQHVRVDRIRTVERRELTTAEDEELLGVDVPTAADLPGAER